MRTFFSRLLFPALIFGLISCSHLGNKEVKKERDYQEIEHLKISYNSMFSQANPSYFVYFYSFYCGHCVAIKDDVIDFALSNRYPFYFIEYEKEIPIISNVEITIGAKDISSFGILGTPSLVNITNNEVIKNIAGESNILNYLIELSTD